MTTDGNDNIYANGDTLPLAKWAKYVRFHAENTTQAV